MSTHSFQSFDVTDDKTALDTAFQLVAENYAQFSTSDISTTDVYQDLCVDPYHQAGVAHTLLVMGKHPIHNTMSALATARVTVGQPRSGNLPPLEAMDLVSPLEGWDSFQFMNFNPKMAAEIGRLVVIPECRKSKIGDMSLVTVLSKLIFWRCVEIARSHGKEQMWAIMPEYTVRVAESFGVHCIPIPEMQLNDQEHHALFQKYDRYWLHSKPWFYRFDI